MKFKFDRIFHMEEFIDPTYKTRFVRVGECHQEEVSTVYIDLDKVHDKVILPLVCDLEEISRHLPKRHKLQVELVYPNTYYLTFHKADYRGFAVIAYDAQEADEIIYSAEFKFTKFCRAFVEADPFVDYIDPELDSPMIDVIDRLCGHPRYQKFAIDYKQDPGDLRYACDTLVKKGYSVIEFFQGCIYSADGDRIGIAEGEDIIYSTQTSITTNVPYASCKPGIHVTFSKDKFGKNIYSAKDMKLPYCPEIKKAKYLFMNNMLQKKMYVNWCLAVDALNEQFDRCLPNKGSEDSDKPHIKLPIGTFL